jgi:hypothetical protein
VKIFLLLKKKVLPAEIKERKERTKEKKEKKSEF